MIALLRGINVGGKHLVPMGELSAIAKDLGLHSVKTYINSGNLLFCSDLSPKTIESLLEERLLERFEFAVPVVVRTAMQWRAYASSTPFAEAQTARPNFVLLALSKLRPHTNAVETLSSKATSDEKLALVDDALWIDFAQGQARSKLTPAVLDRAMGSATTTRNFRTVLKLDALLAAVGT
jgi:uncharacterized protein (DUF1697 family)